jgi:hypothetical protein
LEIAGEFLADLEPGRSGLFDGRSRPHSRARLCRRGSSLPGGSIFPLNLSSHLICPLNSAHSRGLAAEFLVHGVGLGLLPIFEST